MSTLANAAGKPGFANGHRSGATFNAPQGMAAAGSAALFVSDTGNNAIRKVFLHAAGAVSTLAGGALTV